MKCTIPAQIQPYGYSKKPEIKTGPRWGPVVWCPVNLFRLVGDAHVNGAGAFLALLNLEVHFVILADFLLEA